MSKATLVLEDGVTFTGEAIGAKGTVAAALFFDTRVVGYQEVMTDPANAGKIIMLTYPLIGNYGVSGKFNESSQAWVKGLVIKEESRMYSNWQAQGSLDDFLKKERLVAITQVDTRSLAVHLRNKGEMWAVISTNGKLKAELLGEIKKAKQANGESRMEEISVPDMQVIKGKIRVGVLDLGVTASLIVQLKHLGLEIVILPYNTAADKILKLQLKGLIISSGPEDDPGIDEVLPTLKSLVGKIPLLGIALGSQLIARSLGAKIKKMHLGHHGVNYPIKSVGSLKGEITVQNHSRVVDLASLKKIKDVQITAVHLNDGTVESFESRKKKIMAVQYQPASPGFAEINSLLTRFLKLMKGN